MSAHTDFIDLLYCPKTRSGISEDGVQLRSEQGEHYPIINGIPWLLPNPLHSMVDWSIKLNHFQQVLSAEIQQLEHACKKSTGFTLQRLQKLLQHKKSFQLTISSLIAPILTAKVSGKPINDALSDRAPTTQNLLSYEANLYRDWVWGEQENQDSASVVVEALSGYSPEKILVLGAGSGKLAFDLHCHTNPKLTIASDINPLLIFAAKEILFGNGLEIDEFPMHPKSLDAVAISHKIEPINAPDNFHLLFADAVKPALKPESVDTVVTPWLIDIQPFALEKFLAAINHYLPIGGYWVNFGSLVFQQARDSLCYSPEEIKHVAAEAGFEVEAVHHTEMAYLKSPYNAGHRVETVWSWRAKKVKHVKQSQDLQNLPNWLLDSEQPIPNTRQIQSIAYSHQIYLELAKQVNGQRSLKQIAAQFSRQHNIDKNEALSLVKDFFKKTAQS
ncbi:MAG: hypothetical protein HWE27_12970 [Gammaproteobacteria bacterium]|nr:hypothetical protein [Gammaproteobacteria bacterium]